MPARRLPSLDLILDEVRHERAAQIKHMDSMDARAGIILGFSGVLVALVPEAGVWIVAARIAAVVGGLSALWTFWPRAIPGINLLALSEVYAEAEPEFTRVRLLDTYVETLISLSLAARRKARRLKISMAALAFGTLLAGVGLVVD